MRQSYKWYLLCSLMLNFLCVYAANEETVKEDFGDPTPEHTIDMSGFLQILTMVNARDSHVHFFNDEMEIRTSSNNSLEIDSTE